MLTFPIVTENWVTVYGTPEEIVDAFPSLHLSSFIVPDKDGKLSLEISTQWAEQYIDLPPLTPMN